MRCAIIHDLPNWLVKSYGNGLSYVLSPKGSQNEGIAFTGDDAAAFRDEVEAGENAGWDYERIFAEMWSAHA